jgi:uncharacterized membrane protein
MWVIVVVGLWILWRRTNEWRWAASGEALIGWILFGWGAFNPSAKAQATKPPTTSASLRSAHCF